MTADETSGERFVESELGHEYHTLGDLTPWLYDLIQ
jgi:hypothetical protein